MLLISKLRIRAVSDITPLRWSTERLGGTSGHPDRCLALLARPDALCSPILTTLYIQVDGTLWLLTDLNRRPARCKQPLGGLLRTTAVRYSSSDRYPHVSELPDGWRPCDRCAMERAPNRSDRLRQSDGGGDAAAISCPLATSHFSASQIASSEV